MRLSKIDTSKGQPKSASLMLRLILRGDEIFRLPANSRGVQVVSGLAWLTIAGKDVFLRSGERLWLIGGKDVALVSALGRAPLILEVLGDSPSSSTGRRITSQQSQPGTV